MCSEVIFTKLVETVLPMIEASRGSMCIILPPQPRYLFNPCCADQSHCTNLPEEGHAGKILSATAKLRGVLKRKLGPALKGSHWVLDTCVGVQDPE